MKARNVFLLLLIVSWIGIVTILLTTTISNDHIYEAEKLPGITGRILEGDDASGRFYRFSSSNESGFVIFGPYVKIPEGDYLASFRLKTDAKFNLGPIATLDIFSLETGKIREMQIYTKDFKDLNSYQSFIVPFKSDDNSNIEFRVNKYTGNNLWIDNITISPLDSFTVYKSVFVQIVKMIIFIVVGLIIITIIRNSKMDIFDLIKKYFHFSIKIDMLLFISILFVYTIIVLGLVGQIHEPTGDEPHYLIITHSIIKDGDIYLENNYLNKDYLTFFPHSSIDPHISLDKYGRWLPSHGIGLPILFAVPYSLLGLLGVRLFLAFVAALLAMNIFYLIKELLGNEKIAFMTCIFVTLTSPLLFYSYTVYPETMAALILVYSTRVLFKVYNKQHVSKYGYFLCGILMAYLPWLGIKYVMLMIPLTILFFIYNKNEKIRIITPAIISSFLYIVFMLKMFGSLSPTNFVNGVSSVDNYFPVSNLFSPTKIASYFFDQQVGLIFDAPIYILCIVGIILFIKDIKSKRDIEKFLMLSLPSIFYFLTYVTSNSWGGGSPPGRPLVAIIPFIAFLLAIGLSFFSIKKIQTNIDILFVISFSTAFILLKYPGSLFNNWWNSSLDTYGKNNLLAHIGSPFIDFTKIFPSFLTKNSLDNWIYLLFWLGLFSIMIIIEYIYRLNDIRPKKEGS